MPPDHQVDKDIQNCWPQQRAVDHLTVKDTKQNQTMTHQSVEEVHEVGAQRFLREASIESEILERKGHKFVL